MKKQITTFILLLLSIYLLADPIMWNKTIEASWGSEGNSVIQDHEGNYIVAGVFATKISDDSWDANCGIVKFDTLGNIKWKRNFGMIGSYEQAWQVKETPDSNYVVLSGTDDNSYRNTWMLKINSNTLDTLWTKKYLGYLSHFDVYENSDIVIGGNLSGGNRDSYIIKLNSQGDTLFTKNLHDEPAEGWIALNSIIALKDNSFIAVITQGVMINPGNITSLYRVIKFTDNGEIVWEKSYTSGRDSGMKIIEIDDGYIVGGQSYTMGPWALSIFLAKLDVNGNELWKKSYGKPGCSSIASLINIEDAYLIMSEEHQFIKIDSNGNIIWNRCFDDAAMDYSELYSIVSTADQGYIATGWTHFYYRNENPKELDIDHAMLVLKLDKDCNNDYYVGIDDNDELSVMNYQLSQNYPNPFNPTTTIKYNLYNKNFKSAKIYVYNIKGEIIKEFKKLKNNQGFVQFNASKFNSGLYYYGLVIDGERQNTKSMVLIK